MTNNSLYIIGETSVFLTRQTELGTIEENGLSVYMNKLVSTGRLTQEEADEKQTFTNRGQLRPSNDGTKMLLEESPKMFLQEDIDNCEFTGTNEEVQAYIQANPDDWESEIII